MSLEVQALKGEEYQCKAREDILICPSRWSVIWAHEEIHNQNSTQEPVVEAILE